MACDVVALESLGLVLKLVDRVTILALLVDNRDTLKRQDEILRLSRDTVSISSPQVVEIRHLLENKVDNRNDDGDSKGIGVDADDCDDIGPVSVSGGIAAGRYNVIGPIATVDEPAKESEHGGQNVDNQDGSSELEGRPGEAGLNASDEDCNVVSKSVECGAVCAH